MIRLEGFSKSYGKLQAVKPLDLEVYRGESFALLGPNGSGKTTIIRALVGLHRPSTGRILIDGIDVVRSPVKARERLSYAPQRVTMPEMLTAREVAVLFGRLKGVPDSRVEEVLDLFALTDSADRRTREFSGGMLQAALALASSPMVSVAKATSLPRSWPRHAAAGRRLNLASSGPPLGRPRWLIRINRPPRSITDLIDGSAMRTRRSSVTLPCSSSGTLKSTRISTVLLATSTS